MRAGFFIKRRRPLWKKLEKILNEGQSRKMSSRDLHTLTRLYPALATDVALARKFSLEAGTQKYLNDLAIRCHGLLYTGLAPKSTNRWRHFFTKTYPQLFRKLKYYIWLSVAVFALGMGTGFVDSIVNPNHATLYVPRGLDIVDSKTVTSQDVSERYRMQPGSVMTVSITTNNIRVAVIAFAGGVLAGIGSIFLLLFNGLMLGGFMGHFYNHGLMYPVAAFLTPHGCLEIFAIIVAGAAGLRMGLSIAMPGRLRRGEALRHGASDALLLLAGTIPMFIVAGFTESFITPASEDIIPDGAKIIIGISLLVLTLGWLKFIGRKRSL
jgi:uncharacterized membrane protein SpoIIM required for sporulation